MRRLFLRWKTAWSFGLPGLLLLVSGTITQTYADPFSDQLNRDVEVVRQAASEPSLNFDDVRPVLERRCVVCHGCYDAPCQLKLSSYEGVSRGANKIKVYDKGRFNWQQPTRLFIDARSNDEWRQMNFFSVLNEAGGDAEQNLRQSLLYRMINLKQRNALAGDAILPEDIDVGIDRKQVCTTLEGYSKFEADHPFWGMPFGAAPLSDAEYARLVRWLGQGAKAAPVAAVSDGVTAQVAKWEAFLNAGGNKAKLVSRYIYEHIVLAHIHFEGAPEREFFRLVRSRTASGPIDEIPSVRPYDDPGVKDFYYRLRPYRASIVDKSHLVYELSDARMQRYQQLFLGDNYTVASLPAYSAPESSNWLVRNWAKIEKLFNRYDDRMSTPFEIFAQIPIRARYQFLLDDARFFINGFIKGPVCRGVGALSSIEDQFWVFFLKPENPGGGMTQHGLDTAFLDSQKENLRLPTELANTSRILTAWIKYWPREQRYMQAKLNYYEEQDQEHKMFPIDIGDAVARFIWDGQRADGSVNPNATLTVFRNLDSASVHYGLLGDEPETAWLLDYPVFERLHYLLVAGYNTFGTLGHQASARLYMDFLRTEGEDMFLFLLPVDERKRLFNYWHGVDRSTTREANIKTSAWLEADSVRGYGRGDEQHQLFERLRSFVAAKSPDAADFNRCNANGCFTSKADRAMQRLANLNNQSYAVMPLQHFPALSLVRVGGDAGKAYTLIYNKTYRHYEKQDGLIKELLDRDEMDMRGDTLTVLSGIGGAYPNFFFDLKEGEVDAFVNACEKIASAADYTTLVERFGVRRTSPKFWLVADWFQSKHMQAQPIEGGILDLSRYENR